MTTLIKKKAVSAKRTIIAKPLQVKNQDANPEWIAREQIDPSPFNHRKIYVKSKLEELAASFKIHGILHALIVRKSTDGRYELVTGERRIRAARIARLDKVPCIVKDLSDQQVREIQLLENLQRENPHPLEDCWSIRQMQEDGKSIIEISALLGKSKAFIFGRIQLTKLIASFHEPFLEDKLSLKHALEIAELSATSQQEIFEKFFTQAEDHYWDMDDLSNAICRYQFDLNSAPFNTKDKQLLPEIGSCQGCAFNSATYHSLFPELNKQAICSNRDCYKNKCITTQANLYRRAVSDHDPQAILHFGYLADDISTLLDSLEETVSLPRFYASAVNIIAEPKEPAKEAYMKAVKKGADPVFDEAGYKKALEKFEKNQNLFKAAIGKEGTQKGILIKDGETRVYYFTEREHSNFPVNSKVTAKEVQEAIKEGKATPELLQKEINRITEREKRSAELDRITVQESVHKQFLNDQESEGNIVKPSSADITALRLIIYHSLGHRLRNLIDEKMIPDNIGFRDHEGLLKALANLTEEQFFFMVRMSLAGDPQSRTPGNITAHAFYKMAAEAGTDVAGIEARQAEASRQRIDKAGLKIKEMENRIEQLKQRAAAVKEK